MFGHKAIHAAIIIACLGLAMSTATADITEGLVGYWTFDEGGGTIAFDSSGNGNDGTLQGDPQWVTGVLGGALEFDGTGDYVEVPDNESLHQWETFTLSAWIYQLESRSSRILDKATAGTSNGPHMDTHPGTTLRSCSGNTCDSTAAQYTLEEWHHVAVTFDQGDKKLYIDGSLEGSASTSSPLAGNTIPFRIGGDSNGQNLFHGIIDEAAFFSRALTEDEIITAMNGLGARELAADPVPADGGDDVLRDTTLEWTQGEFAATHDLYMGENFEDVNDATVPMAAGLDVAAFALDRLDFGKTYFWRVDEVNGAPDNTVFKGNVWSFTTEPFSIMIPVDVNHVTASSSAAQNPPGMTVNGSGLTGSTHSTESEDMWLTASGDLSPWLMFEFDEFQKLDQLLIWNSNNTSESFIGWGIKDVTIETSMDGTEWTSLADPVQVSRAPGQPTYDAPQAIDLGLALAKYVRINILSNWGGLLKQYGVSEVQFYGLPVYARTPDPASGSVDVLPNLVVAWRAGREADQHTVFVDVDPYAVADGSALSGSSDTNRFDLSSFDLRLGETYTWRVDEVNEAEAMSVWQGPLWDFSTVSYLTVDDFESYRNLSPNRPFQTWLDGYGYSADEFFPVAYPGNGTGAGIGHDIWSPGSPYFDGSIMDTVTTMPGSSQSMPFYYTNTGGTASQTERTFAASQDWTIGGVKTLSIAFFGQPGNTGTLYVKINNSKITYPYDPTHIARDAWQAWNIDLSSLNVQNVTTLQIGVDGAGASGMILIDDIILVPETGQVLTPSAPTRDYLVGEWTFDENGGTVAVDSSGHGHNGTIENGTWEAGPVGSALHFDGMSSQVIIPAAAWDTIVQQASVCLWAYVDSALVQSPVTFAAYQDPVNGQSRVMSTHIVWSNGNLYFDSGGDATNYDRISKAAPASVYGDAWIHWAFTKNADTGEQKVYRNGMLWLSGTGLTRPMTGVTTFTLGAHNNANFWNGSMDEFQLYNRELTQEEILWLAGVTSPMDKPFE
ncbi:MAG: discoidin domain-containing protein [Phycisphaerae bacterium]|nr:discoidin domain-containing protein [Phycisphaerae bacterium]